jgi:hypothetical protein
LKLKSTSTYNYIHDSIFPGQGSGVSLVRQMQPGSDLENEWVMFDHVKRVKDWTTMGIHVYQKVMTIAVCDLEY